MQHGACCRIQRARQDTVSRSLVGVGVWRAQVQMVDQAWRVSCLPMYHNQLSSESITAWRVAEKFFVEFFGFLFDNTSACYLVFAFFFPTILYSILLLCYFIYGLEYCVCLSAHIYTIPHLVLSQCKINRAVSLIWGSKQLLCFQHIFELSTFV